MIPPQIILQALPHIQEPQHVPSETQVPARVKVAIGFLQSLTNKTAPQPLPCKTQGDSEVSYEAMKGQNLTPEEQIARRSALKILEKYFSGKLTPNEWERWEMGWDENGKAKKGHSMVMDCPRCGPSGSIPKHSCLFCRGKGHVTVGLLEE